MVRHLRELPREKGSVPGNPDEPETKKKKAVKRSPAQRKKPACRRLSAGAAVRRGRVLDLGWVVDVPAWDADEAARLKEKDAALDEFANDFYQGFMILPRSRRWTSARSTRGLEGRMMMPVRVL